MGTGIDRTSANRKSPVADSIPAEVYAFAGPKLNESLTSLFSSIWTQEKLPREDPSVIHHYKRKGNSNACDNNRPTYLLLIAGKILVRVLLNRLNSHLERYLHPKSQCRFREGRRTVDSLRSSADAREMSAAECRPVHHLREPD